MDQERPHEAPRSEVMETLDDWRAAWNRYGTPITAVIAAALIAYAGYNFFQASRTNAYNEAWSALAGSTAPASYRGVAEESSDPAVRQNARLAAADLLLDEAVREPFATASEDQGASSDAAAGDPLDQAEALYQATLDEAQSARAGVAGHPLYRLNALEGLAIVAEARRDEDLARERFEAVIAYADTLPGLERWSARARGHLEALPLLRSNPVFAPEPPAEAEAPAEEAQAPAAESEAGEEPAASLEAPAPAPAPAATP